MAVSTGIPTDLPDSRAGRSLLSATRPGCPQCGDPGIWVGWAATTDVCVSCEFDLNRHGWSGAVWINTWVAIVAVMSWIVSTAIGTGGNMPAWVLIGGLGIAAVVPVVGYPFAKSWMLRLLLRLDPVEARVRV